MYDHKITKLFKLKIEFAHRFFRLKKKMKEKIMLVQAIQNDKIAMFKKKTIQREKTIENKYSVSILVCLYRRVNDHY